MPDLKTSYLGLQLKNPFIVSSSGLTDNVEKIKELEEYGAAAVVLKSLFEEQIRFEAGGMIDNAGYPEAADYIMNYSRENTLDAYLKLVQRARKETRIPVIASINCVSSSEWVDFAERIQDAGADALELNVFFFPSDKKLRSGDYEDIYYSLAIKVKESISIPFSFKLGPNFTNLPHIVDGLYNRGAKGVVIFNRFYEPDIDIENLQFKSGPVFSSPADLNATLRWTGILSSQFQHIDIAASTGVHDARAAAKLLLAGASSVMVCSALYLNGPEYLNQMVDGLAEWMDSHHFKSLGDFKGSMNYGKIDNPSIYERSQFMRYFSNFH